MRRSAFLTACLVLAATLAGCRENDVPEPATRIVRVAAAANVRPALERLVERFEATHPDVRVSVAYGSSGLFYVQIVNGGPWDLFLSADTSSPRQLSDAGLTIGPPVRYASGRLVLWALDESEIDLSRGLQLLSEPAIRKVAIANPAFAPYGTAAEQTLRTAGLDDAVSSKLVLGENVSQAAQFVESGAADVGLIAKSLALSSELASKGSYVEIPSELHEPIDQDAVILRAANDAALARELIRFLTSAEAQSVWTGLGYGAPSGSAPESR